MPRPQRVAGALLTLVVLAGCTLPRSSDDGGPSAGSSSPVSSTGARIDFRAAPTRAEAGMGPEGFVAYPKDAGRPAVPTTLRFPTGTVKRDFFQIDIGTSYAFALDKDPRHQPTDFEFFLKAEDLDDARSMLSEDAYALGLTATEIDDITASGTSVRPGYVKDQLSTEVVVRDAGKGDGSLNLIYTVAIGSYHNEAVDKILRNGVVSVDVTGPPTREGLGFRPTYDTADVTTEPGKQLRLSVATSRGSIDLPLDSLGSQATGERPTVSVAIAVTSTATLEATVRRSAAALGIDADEAGRFLTGAGPTLETRNFTCSETAVYSCELRLQTSTSDGADNGASYRLTLTYRD